MNSVADVWQVVLERLRAGGLAETAISTWFDEVEAVAIRDMTFYLCCPNDFKRGTIESLFLPNLKAALKEIFSADFDVKLLSAAERESRHCCKVSDEAAFCLIQRPYISKTLLTRRISPRGSP